MGEQRTALDDIKDNFVNRVYYLKDRNEYHIILGITKIAGKYHIGICNLTRSTPGLFRYSIERVDNLSKLTLIDPRDLTLDEAQTLCDLEIKIGSIVPISQENPKNIS